MNELRDVKIETRCVDCGWTTSAPFPLCIKELQAHECGVSC